MKRIPVFPLLMTMAAFGCFCLVYWALAEYMMIPPYVRGLFLLLPALVLGWITWRTYRGKMPSETADEIVLLLSLLFIIAGFLYSFYLFSLDLHGIEDPQHYTLVYEKMKDRPGVENFPAALPESETEILFHYSPQALQGHEVFYLTFTPDAETLKQYRQSFAKVCIWSGSETEYIQTYLWAYGGGKESNELYLFVWDGNVNHGERCFARIEPDGRLTFQYTRG